jgi:hypothetical protein
MRLADELIEHRVPYVMLCGGEPLIVPPGARHKFGTSSAGVATTPRCSGTRMRLGRWLRNADRTALGVQEPSRHATV